MRIAVIHIGQETATFTRVPTSLADFAAFGIYSGDEMVEKLEGLGQVGGYLAAAADATHDIETIPVYRAWAGAGGRITTEARQTFLTAIRDGLLAAGDVDGVALQLHGACSAEGVDDVEGEQAGLCREIVGADVPIVLSLDHHANVTEAMVRHTDAVVGHRTQPHDPFDTGRVAADILFRIVAGEVTPTTAYRKLRLISHQEQYLTSQPPMKTWFDRAREYEASDPKVLQVSNFPMQPWLDVDEAGWAVTVVTDGDEALAERIAEEQADLAWSLREEFQVTTSVSVDDAVRRAHEAPEGIVLLRDTGDPVFGGAVGDSNEILESVLRQGVDSRILMPLVSPETVATLVAAGEGATVTVPVGGSGSGMYDPIEVTGTVGSIQSGKVELAAHSQNEVDMGTTVMFDVGPATLMVSEMRGVGGNLPGVYTALGVDPTDYKMVVLKTASNFQHFMPFATEVIRVNTSGATQSDIAALPWVRAPRPIFPLDDIASWSGN